MDRTRKRPGNPGTPTWIKELVWGIVEDHPDWPSKRVHYRLEKNLGDLGKLDLLPSERTVRKIMRQWAGVDKGEDDAPWNMAVPANRNMTDRAIRDVIGVWRRCLAVGYPFSIRQAKWVARLGAFIGMEEPLPLPESERLWILHHWASRYSRRERASEAQGPSTMTTTDLDGIVAMNPWEHETAVKVGSIDPVRSFGDPQPGILPFPGVGEAVAVELGLGVPQDCGLQGEADRVYAHWLRHLGRGPNWAGMPLQERQGIAQELAIGIRERAEWVKQGGWRQWAFEDWEPAGLLEKAGYEVQPDKESKEKVQ